MKTYFVASDIHGHYTIYYNTLIERGFDIKNENHVLIICGDVFDRGQEAKQLLEFLQSIPEDRLVIVKGNHESLLIKCLNELKAGNGASYHHISNGTINTIEQFTGYDKYDLMIDSNYALFEYDYSLIEEKMKPCLDLISRAVNYYEVNDYIFVHGWIPHVRDYSRLSECSDLEWESAAWVNGMNDWYVGWRLVGKTIVCGHWHTSFGHSRYHNKCKGEFDRDSIFDPFIDDGIIALDACTAFTGKVNVVVIEVEDIQEVSDAGVKYQGAQQAVNTEISVANAEE